MGRIRIALLQMKPEGNDQEQNKQIAEEYCRQAASKGADIALFPEMFNIGYTGFDGLTQEQWRAQAVATDSPWVQHFASLASELDMAIGCTYLEKREGMGPGNSVSLFDRHGILAFTYRKIHTCDFADFEASCSPGEEVYVTDLDTRSGLVKVGAMICYDREFPETARMLMLKGAELVLTPNACPLDEIRRNQFQSRAFENSMVMCMTNYPGELLGGRSVAYSYDGYNLVTAGNSEEVTSVEVDLEQLREYRRISIWGNAFRRPHRYSSLTDMGVESPFERTDGFGRPFKRKER